MTKNKINTSELKLREDVLYINSNIHSGIIAKIGILTINLLAFFSIGFIASMNIAISVSSQAFIIMGIIAIYASIIFPWTLWNFAGKERVLVSTKSIMWEHDYGFFQKKSAPVFHKKLNIETEIYDYHKGMPLVRIIFSSVNKAGFRETIYRSNILMSLHEAETLSIRVRELLKSTSEKKLELPEYVLN